MRSATFPRATTEPSGVRDFFRHWTRFEALLKAHGAGLYGAGAAPPGDWSVTEIEAGPNFAAAVAVEGPPPDQNSRPQREFMKIAVLDGYCMNPGTFPGTRCASSARWWCTTARPPPKPPRAAHGADAVLMNKTPLPADTLARLPQLKYIGVLATGYNVVDIDAARGQGITVTNVPTYGTASVAQFVFALLLELCHNVRLHADAVRAGEWSRNADWSFWKSPLVELEGKTMGVVGFGRIGRSVGRIADAMGMRVIANDTYQGDAPGLSRLPLGSARRTAARKRRGQPALAALAGDSRA